MIVRDENYDDDGYLNPLTLLPVALHPSAHKPATLRPALLCSGRGWIRLGSQVVPVVETWGVGFDDRPDEKQPGFEQVVDEFWIDSIGG